jgi:hypothetical protein
VPNRQVLSGQALDPETIREMSLAPESVCNTLGQHGVRGVATLADFDSLGTQHVEAFFCGPFWGKKALPWNTVSW